jgi:hypothetical protein
MVTFPSFSLTSVVEAESLNHLGMGRLSTAGNSASDLFIFSLSI